jgi:hypothetical protein
MAPCIASNRFASKISILILSCIVLICSCDNKTEIREIKQRNKDSIALTKLTRRVYQWYESSANRFNFEPTIMDKSDSSFSGINQTKLKSDIKTLQASGYFDTQFIDTYKTLGTSLDDLLNSGEIVWNVGELPPFGNDADPWCNCQDSPDRYWDNITLTDLAINKNAAIFNWTWGKNFTYKVIAHKQNSIWKISYLQGFDKNTFLHQNPIDSTK